MLTVNDSNQFVVLEMIVTFSVKLLARGMQHRIINFTTSIIMIYYIFMIMSLLKSLLMCTHLFITTNFSCYEGLITKVKAEILERGGKLHNAKFFGTTSVLGCSHAICRPFGSFFALFTIFRLFGFTLLLKNLSRV